MPQAPIAMPPTAIRRQAPIPNGSHTPTMGWPRWAVSASWWTQSGRFSGGATRSIRYVTSTTIAAISAAIEVRHTPPTATPTPTIAAA